MNSQPSSAIENGLTSQLTPTVAAMPRQWLRTCPSAAEIDLEQHRNDHQPDQHRDRQVDLRDRRRAERMEQARQRPARARCRRRCRAPPTASGSARMCPWRALCPARRQRLRSSRGLGARLPPASTTASPSSLVKAPRCGSGRMSSTASDGRHSFTPSGVTTIGRLMRIGCAIMASSSASSAQGRIVEAQLVVGRSLAAQQLAHARSPCAPIRLDQLVARSAGFSDTR